MKRQRDLDEEQNAHVRKLARDLMARMDLNQGEFGKLIGVKQNTVSRFVSDRGGTSVGVAFRLAELAGVDMEDLLAGTLGPLDAYPGRARALRLVGKDLHPDALRFVTSMEQKGGADLSPLEWMRIILYWEDQARRGALR